MGTVGSKEAEKVGIWGYLEDQNEQFFVGETMALWGINQVGQIIIIV